MTVLIINVQQNALQDNMTRKLRPSFTRLALAVGGSHYPEVGGQLLDQFGQSLLTEIYGHINNCTLISPAVKQLLITDIKSHYETESTGTDPA